MHSSLLKRPVLRCAGRVVIGLVIFLVLGSVGPESVAYADGGDGDVKTFAVKCGIVSVCGIVSFLAVAFGCKIMGQGLVDEFDRIAAERQAEHTQTVDSVRVTFENAVERVDGLLNGCLARVDKLATSIDNVNPVTAVTHTNQKVRLFLNTFMSNWKRQQTAGAEPEQAAQLTTGLQKLLQDAEGKGQDAEKVLEGLSVEELSELAEYCHISSPLTSGSGEAAAAPSGAVPRLPSVYEPFIDTCATPWIGELLCIGLYVGMFALGCCIIVRLAKYHSRFIKRI
jgi:hypothetical protein